MKLYYKCEYCLNENRFKYRAKDRLALKIRYPQGVNIACGQCHEKNTVHPNSVQAKESKILILLIYLLALIISSIAVYYIFITYWRNELGSDLALLEVLGMCVGIPFLIITIYNK